VKEQVSPRAIIAFDCIFPAQTGGGERVYRAIAEELVASGWDVEYLTRGATPELKTPFAVTPIWTGSIYNSEGSRPLVPALKFAMELFKALVRRRSADLVIVSATPVLNVFAANAALAWKPSCHLVVDWLEIWPASKWREYSGTIIGSLAWVAQTLALWSTKHATANSAETISRMPQALQRRNPTLLALTSMNTSIEPRISSRQGPPTILYVGRLIPDKCVETIPPALVKVLNEHPDARAVLIGEGPELERVRKTAVTFGVGDRMEFLGKVDDVELRSWYREATVLVNPSRREGFGLVVVEAAAGGTPAVLVSGPDNAASQLIEPGVNGYVVDSHSPEALAVAIIGVIEMDSSLRKSTFEWFERRSSAEPFSLAVEKMSAPGRPQHNGSTSGTGA
jgi:glycosyltransferase involved in cell wall biosynthesis